jgi:hypothetical protein
MSFTAPRDTGATSSGRPSIEVRDIISSMDNRPAPRGEMLGETGGDVVGETGWRELAGEESRELGGEEAWTWWCFLANGDWPKWKKPDPTRWLTLGLSRGSKKGESCPLGDSFFLRTTSGVTARIFLATDLNSPFGLVLT